MISRSLFTSKKFNDPTLNDSDRTRYIGEVISADDDGRLDGCPISLKMECFPGLPYTVEEITDSLKRQDKVGLIEWYEVDNQKVIQITGWDEHQTFHGFKRYPSLLPTNGQPETEEIGVPSQPETIENGLTIPKDKIREDKIKDIYTVFTHFCQKKNTITHRELTKAFETAISAKLKTYSVDEICSAIDEYDFVVGSNDHYFNYASWSIKDFLQRGLEKFLPANKPRDNFKTNTFGKNSEPSELQRRLEQQRQVQSKEFEV